MLKTQFCFVFKQKSPTTATIFSRNNGMSWALKACPVEEIALYLLSFYLKILKLRQRLELGYL